jgi:hypothetical protein
MVTAGVYMVARCNVLYSLAPIGPYLHGPKGSGGISSKIGISCSPGEDDDSTLLQMSDRSSSNIGFCDLTHLNRSMNSRASWRARPFILESETVRGDSGVPIGRHWGAQNTRIRKKL